MQGADFARFQRPVLAPPGAANEIRPANRLEIFALMLGVYIYCGGIGIAYRVYDASSQNSVNAFATAGQATVLALMLVVTGPRWQIMFRTMLRAAPVLIPIAVMAASYTWSLAPDRTVRRMGTMVIMVWFVIYARAVFDPTRMMRYTLFVLMAFNVISLGLVPIAPAYVTDAEVLNALAGVFGQKNVYGAAMLMATLALSFLVMCRGRVTWRDVVVAACIAAGLIGSRSASAMMTSFLVMALTLVLLQARHGGVWAAAMTVLALLIETAGVVLELGGFMDTLLDVIGKDSTLTGRATIWTTVFRLIAERPILGTGYSAFWLPDQYESEWAWAEIGWLAPSAHSGYLDLMLQLGYPGVIAALALLFMTLARIGRNLFVPEYRVVAMWGLIMLVAIGIRNIDESDLLIPDLPMALWVLLLCILPTRPPRRAPKQAARFVTPSPRVPG